MPAAITLGIISIPYRSALPSSHSPTLSRPNVPTLQRSSAPTHFASRIRPFIEAHCLKCHQGAKAKANIDFGPIQSESDALAAKPLWKKTWTKLHNHLMPPPERPQPDAAERERVETWIESTFGLVDGERDPGRVTLRRLSRVEYRNTVRDLTGIDFKAADDFPADDIGYGFDNNGDVLSLPPILMEKYFDAAGTILDRAIVTTEQRAPVTRAFKGNELSGNGGGRASAQTYDLYSNGDAGVDVKIRLEASYVIRVSVGGDQAGPDPVKMALYVDADQVSQADVRERRDKPALYEVAVRLKPGPHRIAAAFLNDYYQPQAKNPADRDRNMIVHSLELIGPIDLPAPETHTRIFISKDPGEIISAFASRAFRRPAAPEEVGRLLSLFEKASKGGGSFETAMKLPLRAILVSPSFLFRVEMSRGELGEHELASRLSYFLWSSMPDAELMALARSGRLRATLDAQIERMLGDPRASTLAENFAMQWLQLRRLRELAPDPLAFPQFDEDLRAAMAQEAILFFESVLRENRPVTDLLDANYTFLNERLARHYGIEGVGGAQMRRVRLSDPRRGGVLTMAGVLATTSNATRTSPPRRGKWVLETILGAPPPPPLPDAGTIKENAADAAQVSLRRRLEQHRQNVKCAPCHALMDPLGFGFENYDAVGAWREKDEAGPVDTAATLPDGRAFKGPVELKVLLLAQRDDFVRCLGEKLMTYALGRGVEYYDGPDIRAIGAAAAADGYRLSAMVKAVAKSWAFQHRRRSDANDE